MGTYEIYINEEHNEALQLNFCGMEACSTGHSFGPAIRAHYLFHFITAGSGTYTLDGHTYHLSQGDGFMIHPGSRTFYKADDLTPWTYYWVGFSGYKAKEIVASCGLEMDSPIFHASDMKTFYNTLESIILRAETFNRSANSRYEQLSLLYGLFAQMSEKLNIPPTTHHNAIDYAVDYIHDNYAYDIRVSQLAHILGLERSYLFRLFKERIGISPQQYLLYFRLNKAAELLKHTPLAINEIGYSVGFSSQALFYRHFKKTYGLTPKAYRDAHS